VFNYCALLLGSELHNNKHVFVNAATYIFDHIADHKAIPLLPSFIPIADSFYSDRMSFFERLRNAVQSTTFGLGGVFLTGAMLLEQYHQFAEGNRINKPRISHESTTATNQQQLRINNKYVFVNAGTCIFYHIAYYNAISPRFSVLRTLLMSGHVVLLRK
jgi:hypothetical protein